MNASPKPGFWSSYQRADSSMSESASRCLAGTLMGELLLQLLKIIRFKWFDHGRIGLEVCEAAL